MWSDEKKRLGKVLWERGHVSAADLNAAFQEQQAQARLVHLGELMLQRGLVSKGDLTSALMEVAGIPYFDCTSAQIEPQTLQRIPGAMARRCHALPVGFDGAELVVAMAEPQNLRNDDELRFKTEKAIAPRLAFRSEIDVVIAKYYGPGEELMTASGPAAASREEDRAIEFISSSEQQRNIEAMREMQVERNQKSKTTPAVLLVAEMIRPRLRNAPATSTSNHTARTWPFGFGGWAAARIPAGSPEPAAYCGLTCARCRRNLAANLLCCPYCGAQVTVEAEAKPPRFSLVRQSAVNE